MKSDKFIQIKPGREKAILRGHPWIFSGAVNQVVGNPGLGETIEVVDAKGSWIARAAWSPKSQIIARVWTRLEEENIDEGFFGRRVEQAIKNREEQYPHKDKQAYRLLFAESDGIPGLVVDRFSDYLIVQFSAAGVDRHRHMIVAILQNLTGVKGIYERSDLGVRSKEGLEVTSGLLSGILPDGDLLIEESGIFFQVNFRDGHKTGFYLDQKENRKLVRDAAAGKEVLDCFCYSGGFGISALSGGARHVSFMDSSGPALMQASANLTLNGYSESQYDLREADVFRQIRKNASEGKFYDMIILDPPKLVEARQHLEKGARAYKDLNLHAMKMLRPGGLLFTFSCSGHIEDFLFQKIVADAALDAKRNALIMRWLSQGPDHPVNIQFPEGKYLKGLMVRVD